MKTLGARIYFLRVSGGRRSQGQFGAEIAKAEGRDTPYSANTISDWEDNKTIPPLSAIVGIVNLTGASLDFLVFGSGNVGEITQNLRGVA